jgi:hypothetical protein
MPAAAVTIASMEFAAALGGWTIHAQIVGADGSTRTGPQFVELGADATPEQLRATLAAMYP